VSTPFCIKESGATAIDADKWLPAKLGLLMRSAKGTNRLEFFHIDLSVYQPMASLVKFKQAIPKIRLLCIPTMEMSTRYFYASNNAAKIDEANICFDIYPAHKMV
jgi:hypothetical protein